MKSITFFVEFEGRLVINLAPRTGDKRYAGPRTFFSAYVKGDITYRVIFIRSWYGGHIQRLDVWTLKSPFLQFARDEYQLVLPVQALYDSLPADVIVWPSNSEMLSGASRDLSEAFDEKLQQQKPHDGLWTGRVDFDDAQEAPNCTMSSVVDVSVDRSTRNRRWKSL